MLVFRLAPTEVFAVGGPGTYYVNTKEALTDALSQVVSVDTIIKPYRIRPRDIEKV